MKKARIALPFIILLYAIMLFSGNAVFFTPPVFASSSGIGSPTATIGSDIGSPTVKMNCLQPPTNVDHATLPNVELDKYSLPHYIPGKDKAAWKDMVRSMKHRVCSGTPIPRRSSFATSMHPNKPLIPTTPTCRPYNLVGNDIWTGNITVNSSTDPTCTQNNMYVEADAVFYVPCIKSGSPSGEESSWVGLGGWNDNNLVQAGTESDVSYNIFGSPSYNYYAWTENTAASNSGQIWLFSVNCGDRMQVFVGRNYTTIYDRTNGNYNNTRTSPLASTATAEWIVERTSSCNIFNQCSPNPLSDFRSDTFYGMGTTLGSGDYVSPADVDHDFSNMNGRTRIGPLVPNTAWGPPNYANTITWLHQ